MQEFGISLICNSFVTRDEMKRLVFEKATGAKFGRTSPDFEFHIVGKTNDPCSSKQNAQILAQDRYLKSKNRLNSIFAVPFKADSAQIADIGKERLDILKYCKSQGLAFDKIEYEKLTGSKMGINYVYYFIVGKITY